MSQTTTETRKWIDVAGADGIADGEVKTFQVEAYRVAVARANGQLYAVQDLCSHDDGPLGAPDAAPLTAMERDRLRARIAKLNLGEHVTLAGSVGDEALAKLYVESAVFVLANRMLANGDVEGCPVVFAEAAAYGLPVIGGKVGGASSLIDDQKTGLLVAADDIDELAAAMRRLLSSPELGDQMGAAGRTKILRDHAPAVIGQQFTVALTRHVRDDGLR